VNRKLVMWLCVVCAVSSPCRIYFRPWRVYNTAQSDWAFTLYDRRTDRSVRPRLRPTVCQTSRTHRSVTVAEPPTSVNQINVAC